MNYLLQAGLEAGLILVLNVANVCPAELCSGCEGAVADNGIRWVCVCVCMKVSGEQSTPARSLQCPRGLDSQNAFQAAVDSQHCALAPQTALGISCLRVFACVFEGVNTMCVLQRKS